MSENQWKMKKGIIFLLNTYNNNGGGAENRPKNIALNFYCKVNEL